jgi:hypothetical protein
MRPSLSEAYGDRSAGPPRGASLMIMARSAVENDLVDRLAAYPGCAEPDVRIPQLEIRRRCTTAGLAISDGALMLILPSSGMVSTAPGTVSRLGKLCHSTAY